MAASYYATEQFTEGERAFKFLLPNRLITRLYRPDLKYLENILRKIVPLNREALSACTTKIHISLTDVETRGASYRCLNDASDPVPIVLAGTSWLVPCTLDDGRNYADGCFSENPLAETDRLGIRKIWMLSVEPFGFRVGSLVPKVVSRLLVRKPKMRRLFSQLAEVQNRQFQEIEQRTDLRVIRPDEPLPIDLRGTNPAAINRAFELGIKSADDFIRKHEKEF